MKKILYLFLVLVVSTLLSSCDDERSSAELYGTWVPKEHGQNGNIFVFNSDNTGTLYYLVETKEDGTFICDECLTEKIIGFTLKEKTVELKFESYTVPYFYDYLNENEFKMIHMPALKRVDNPKIKEEKRSCESL